VTGQVVGVRATEVTVWSQPRPAAAVVGAAAWDPTRLVQDAEPRLAAHLTPLESEFDLFSAGPPAPGDGTH
jgi:carboxylesterase type B